MAKIVGFTIGRAFTIMDGFDADKPNFSLDVKLEEGDDLIKTVFEHIEIVNAVLLAIHDSGQAELPDS